MAKPLIMDVAFECVICGEIIETKGETPDNYDYVFVGDLGGWVCEDCDIMFVSI